MRVLAQLRLALTLAWLRLRLTWSVPLLARRGRARKMSRWRAPALPLLAWRRPAFRLLIVQLAWPRPART